MLIKLVAHLFQRERKWVRKSVSKMNEKIYTSVAHCCSESQHLFSSESFHRFHTYAHIHSTKDFFRHSLGLMQCQLNCLLLLLCRSAWSWIVGVAYAHVRRQTEGEAILSRSIYVFVDLPQMLSNSFVCFNSIRTNPIHCNSSMRPHFHCLSLLLFSFHLNQTITIHKYIQVKENYQLRNASSALHWIVSNECLKYINIDSDAARTPTMKRKIEKVRDNATTACLCVYCVVYSMDGWIHTITKRNNEIRTNESSNKIVCRNECLYTKRSIERSIDGSMDGYFLSKAQRNCKNDTIIIDRIDKVCSLCVCI